MSPCGTKRPGAGFWASAAAAGLIAAFFAWTLARYGFAFPFMDQWEFVVTLEKAWNGTLTWGHLFSQHNEHRVFFPRLVMLALALPSGWAIELEIVANLAFGLVLFACAALLLAPEARTATFVVPLALLVFNLHQWRNYAWGWQMQVLMSCAAVVAGALVLHRARGTATRLAAGVALGVIATFSFASGMVYWVALAPALVWAGPPGAQHRPRAELAMWALAFVLCVTVYLWGYHRPVDHAPLLSGLASPGRFAVYVAAWLGGPVAAWRPWAAPLAGAGGLVVAAAAGAWLAWHGHARHVTPHLGLCAFSLGAALLTALGRSADGAAQALSSRYATPAMLFWAGALGLALVLAREARPRARGILAATGLVLVASLALTSRHGYYALQERHAYYAPAAAALAHGDRALLHRLYTHPELLDTRLRFLQRHGLTAVFRNREARRTGTRPGPKPA